MCIETRERIANLVSNFFNPFLVSLAIIGLLSFTSASSPLDAIRWVLISIAVSILPVFLAIVYLVRKGRLDAVFTNVRGQRTKIYWRAVAFISASCIILLYLGAPPILLATFVAGLSAVVIFMCINLWWKISLHTAFIAASVAVLVMVYGWIAVVTIVLVPLISWARIELGHHSLAQVATGTLLAALNMVVVFYLFGLV